MCQLAEKNDGRSCHSDVCVPSPTSAAPPFVCFALSKSVSVSRSSSACPLRCMAGCGVYFSWIQIKMPSDFSPKDARSFRSQGTLSRDMPGLTWGVRETFSKQLVAPILSSCNPPQCLVQVTCYEIFIIMCAMVFLLMNIGLILQLTDSMHGMEHS
jgi:hypothetical protein